MELFRKLGNKNYFIKIIVITLSLMLFKTAASNFLIKYLDFLPELGLDFVSMFLIIIITALLSEEILEV